MSEKQAKGNELQELLKHQQAIKEVSGQIEALHDAIEVQEEMLDKYQAQLPDLETLEQQRENLLADIATGKAETASLDALDEQLEAEQAASLQLAPLIVRCQKTLVGLNRKLLEETESLSQLQNQSAQYLCAYLFAEAERDAEAYVNLGSELVKKFSRIDALCVLLSGFNYQTMRHPNAVTMSLPAFNLEAFRGHTVFNRPGTMFLESPTQAQRLGWAEEEKTNLRAQGIEIE